MKTPDACGLGPRRVRVWTSHFLQRVSPATIYHVTVMPCYDKKLEASRPDFYSPEQHSREVDCVITTGEACLGSSGRSGSLILALAGLASRM